MITREQVENKTKELFEGNFEKTKAVFKIEIENWLISLEATEIQKKQILNDLESYSYFHNLET